jgi:hypothetical protein
MATYNILTMGASYGSLLASQLHQRRRLPRAPAGQSSKETCASSNQDARSRQQ